MANDNQSAYEYNKGINFCINDICQDFLRHSFATEMAYHKIYYNGDAISVSTNLDMLKHYFIFVQEKGLFFKKFLHNIPENKSFYFLWPDKIENDLHGIIHHLGIWNGFNIYIKHNNYIENFVLTSTLHSKQMQNYCINNLDIVESFIGFFREKTENLFSNFDQKNMAFFNCKIELENLVEPRRFPNFKLNKMPFYIDNTKIYFSNREALCLSYLSAGYTSKYIGNMMNISPRTVEKYITQIKEKTNGLNRIHLNNIILQPENSLIKNLRTSYENERNIR